MICIPHKSASKTRIHVSNHRKAPASLQYCGVKPFPSVTLWYRSIPPFHECPAFFAGGTVGITHLWHGDPQIRPYQEHADDDQNKTLHLRYTFSWQWSTCNVYSVCVCIIYHIHVSVIQYVFAYILILRLSIWLSKTIYVILDMITLPFRWNLEVPCQLAPLQETTTATTIVRLASAANCAVACSVFSPWVAGPRMEIVGEYYFSHRFTYNL